MPRMTEELFREILKAAESDIDTLEIEKTLIDAEDSPTPAECSAIERVQAALKVLAGALKDELPK